MLKRLRTDVKATQELLGHSSVRRTLDTYTQAIMPAKRAGQAAVVSMILTERPRTPVTVAPFCNHKGLAEKSVSGLLRMAGTTRLELATSAVTGQRSNQLNYVPNRGINNLA